MKNGFNMGVKGKITWEEAIYIQQRNKISFWDAMIVCSAKKLGCKIIWTEDLNQNQLYEGS